MRLVAIVVGIVLGVVGGLILLTSILGLVAVGWDNTLDATHRLDTPSAALAADADDLGGDWLVNWPGGDKDKAELTIEATSRTDRRLFLAVGPQRDVQRYLASGTWGEINVFNDRPSERDDPNVKERGRGDATKLPAPTTQSFWTDQAKPGKTVKLTWDTETGSTDKMLVLANADGAPKVDTDTRFELHVPRLSWLLVGGIVVGAVIALLGLLFIFRIGRNRFRTAS